MTRPSRRALERAIEDLTDDDTRCRRPATVEDAARLVLLTALEDAAAHPVFGFAWREWRRGERRLEDVPDGYVPLAVGASYGWFVDPEYVPAALGEELPTELPDGELVDFFGGGQAT